MPEADIAPYSMTSSVRASSAVGTDRPSASAVFKIDHQLIPGRRLDRQIGWLLAIEDAIKFGRDFAFL